MFPTQELTALARGKQAIRLRIARERLACSVAMETVVRPLRWLDRLHARWQTAPAVLKLAAVPVALLLKRKLFPKKMRLGALMRWVPRIWRVARAARG
jgi:hypothetical protein